MDLSILRLDDQIHLTLDLPRCRPVPTCVLLSYRKARDSKVLGDIVYHERHESCVGRQRNHQCGQNEQVQAPRSRLNYRRAKRMKMKG